MQSDLEQRLREDKKRRLRDKIGIAIAGFVAFVGVYTILDLSFYFTQKEPQNQTAVEFKERKKRNYIQRLLYRGDKAKDAAYEFVFGSEQGKELPADKEDNGYISNNR